MAISLSAGFNTKVTVTFPDGSKIDMPISQMEWTPKGECLFRCESQGPPVYTGSGFVPEPKTPSPHPPTPRPESYDPVTSYERSLENLKSGRDPKTVLAELEAAEMSLVKVRDQATFHLKRLEDHIAYVIKLAH